MGHLKGISSRNSQPRVQMTVGRGVLEKFDIITWRFKWSPRFWKFPNKSFQAFLSWNWTWRGGIRSEEEDLEPRGFPAKVDLRILGAIRSLSERERERERERELNTITTQKKRNTKERKDVCMKNVWKCDVQNLNCIIGKKPIQTYQHTFNNNKTHI